MDAIEKYDPEKNCKFKTYAEFRIKGAILDQLRSLDWVPRSIRQKSRKLERAYGEVEQRLGAARARMQDLEEDYRQLDAVRQGCIQHLDEIRSSLERARLQQQEVELNAAGQKLLARYSDQLKTLQTEIEKALPKLDEQQKAAFLQAYQEEAAAMAAETAPIWWSRTHTKTRAAARSSRPDRTSQVHRTTAMTTRTPREPA